MEKILKVQEVSNAYQVLRNAKYQKLEDADKIKLWKVSRQLKPIALKAEEDFKDAATSLKPDGFDKNLEKARAYEKAKAEELTELPMSEEEYKAFLVEFKEFDNLVKKALKEFQEKEVTVKFDALSEEAFGSLMASNEWTLAQLENIEWLVED